MIEFVHDAPPGRVVFAAGALGAPLTLADIGMPEDGLDRAAEAATAAPYANPAPVDFAAVRSLLQDAYAGRADRHSAGRLAPRVRRGSYPNGPR